MRINKNDIKAVIDIPGATARQQMDFGEVGSFGTLAAEYFSLGAGTDMAPLLSGLQNDHCQCPHWGYVLEGQLTVDYTDGSSETVQGGDMFYWPPGHTIRAEQATEMVLFSPQAEHCAVLDHVKGKLGG